MATHDDGGTADMLPPGMVSTIEPAAIEQLMKEPGVLQRYPRAGSAIP